MNSPPELAPPAASASIPLSLASHTNAGKLVGLTYHMGQDQSMLARN